MTTASAILLLGAALLATPARAERTACRCGFEVAAPTGAPLPLRRATKRATAGRCEFAVRLRVNAADGSDRCDGARVTLRGLPAGTDGAWTDGWQRVTLAARGRRAATRTIRARVRGADGGVGRARLLLRCAQPASLAGCEAPFAESVACYVGGDVLPRVVGLDSGESCRAKLAADEETPSRVITGPSLALWNGRLWTCQGSSVMGAFLSTPVGGGKADQVAGPCVATGTDDDSLLVLPHATFDDGPTLTLANRGFLPFAPVTALERPATAIRAYDVPETVPDGPARTVFDLATIPDDSPCAGLLPSAMTGRSGILYASGSRQTSDGSMTPLSIVCRFDTRSGATLDPLALEGFTGRILGLSAIDQDRLLVLASDGVALPPPGYIPEPGSSGAVAGPGGSSQIHVFDAATGARLDTQRIDAGQATGLACVTNTP